ncbi:MAG TPA: DmsC/YnfH family molybdoenzyme membrane anchor subunit [Terracidiphilus sp.]|nr:DmsC/YnfH family molybdoenzyme membrane anchor subunit [Terracidiphilus sp.]
MELPLLTRAQRSDDIVQLVTAKDAATSTASFCGAGGENNSLRLPGPGEQYRFHFDMTKCIGCKCCVVACNEQNGNPADILWRRVGEIEGGIYPDTRRHYLSIGCNHCLEPTCMTGCPVDAYSKDELTGIVRHSAEACIGCQYCTWNCSYGVPQFNPERGVIGKCDMCYGRLEQGQSPACVIACPEDAIQIEIVRVDEWRKEYKELANSPGMPSADDSLSTTRITLPKSTSHGLHRVDLGHLHPESPHWPLVFMTVLTQLSVGAFTAIWRMQAAGAGANRNAALIALLIALCALSASTLHLGRPIHAARALRMWRRSWLSREVLLFTLFAAAATLYSISIWTQSGHAIVAGAATAVLGLAGVGASARLYLAPGRPAWNSPFTILDFFATTLLLGASVADLLVGSNESIWLLPASGMFAVLILAGKLAWLARSSRKELCGSWQLLSTILFNKLLLRVGLLTVGLWLAEYERMFWVQALALAMLILQELLGRYLFFVSVVPTSIASGFLSREAA